MIKKNNSSKKILITGGAGYIGSIVNKELNKKGYKTIVLDNLVYGHKDFVKWGEFIEGDLRDINLLDEIIKNDKIAAIMHFAAFAYVGESIKDPHRYYKNNVINTLRLLDIMLKHKVKHLIFSSSCAIYGNPIRIPIDENHPKKPINPYGWSKFIIEQILKDYENAYDLKYNTLRYFNAAGADPEVEIGEDHNPETHLIPNIMLALLGRKKNVEIYGNDYPTADGTCIRDFVHVVDLATAHILALEKLISENKSNFYNLGNEIGYSIMEVIKTIEKVTRKKVNYKISPRRAGDPHVLISNSEKIKKELEWKPQYQKLEVLVETAWNWHRKRHG